MREAAQAHAMTRIYSFLADVFTSAPRAETVGGVSRMAEDLGVACEQTPALDEIEQEFMELFVVPNPRYVAPYESVFRDRWPLPPVLRRGSNPGEGGPTVKGPLMGESTLAVRQVFLAAGVAPEQDLPDHFGNELRLMAHLWAREATEGPGAGGAAGLRESLREEHILKWIGPLKEKVVEGDRLGFYSAAIQIAEAVLRDDPAGNKEEPGKLRHAGS